MRKNSALKTKRFSVLDMLNWARYLNGTGGIYSSRPAEVAMRAKFLSWYQGPGFKRRCPFTLPPLP